LRNRGSTTEKRDQKTRQISDLVVKPLRNVMAPQSKQLAT
jgi:hypothetical protein